MKRLIVITALAAAAATAVSCKSKAKNEAPVVPAEAVITNDMIPTNPEPVAPITPADLGATTSGLGL